MARAMCWRPRRRRSEGLPGAAATAEKTLRGRRKYFCARACAVALVSIAAAQAAATPLDAYLDGLRTLRASFLQTLVDAHGREIDRATGTLIVARPGKFSWETRPQRPISGGGAAAGNDAGHLGSAGQLMVCDGTNLWFLDRDLAQVTVKPIDAALSATPAMLLAGVADLHQSFSITPAGQREEIGRASCRERV